MGVTWCQLYASTRLDLLSRQMLTNTDRSVSIPQERAQSAGLKHDQVKINPRYGGGYPANVEGLHQLHCLVRMKYCRLLVANKEAEPTAAVTLLQLRLLPCTR